MVVIEEPKNVNSKRLIEFIEYIKLGGQVISNGLRQRVNNARLLGFYYTEDKLTSIVAIKGQNASHQLKVFQDANESARCDNFSFELGWAYTIEAYRGKGMCNEVVQAILKVETENLFATTRCDNLSMQKILDKNGFKVIGKPYEGDGHYSLLLFIKEK